MIVKNEYGTYSVPNEIHYTYTAQTIINGNVHEPTTIEYLKSIGGNIIHAGTGFGDFLPALKNFNVFTFELSFSIYPTVTLLIIAIQFIYDITRKENN